MNPIIIKSSRYVTDELKPVSEIKIIIDLETAQDFYDEDKLKDTIISQLTEFLNHKP